jgi:hypothetical protein
MNNTAITTLTIAVILAATQVVGVTLAMTATTTANAIGSKKGGQDEGSKNNGSLHLHKSKNYYVL